jgi:hypothetical protein
VQLRNVAVKCCLLLLALAVFGMLPLHAQTPTPASPTVTLQAELLKTLDSSHVKAGDEVTARTANPLEFDGTRFPVGATVVGHITKAEPNLLILVFDQIMVKNNSRRPLVSRCEQ